MAAARGGVMAGPSGVVVAMTEAGGVAVEVSILIGGRAATPGGRSAGASEVRRLSMRTLPVWLRVLTGSASFMSCSMFLSDSAGAAAVGSRPVVGRTGGRRTTPCMAGRVRVPRSTAAGAAFLTVSGGRPEAGGVASAGTGLMAGGWGLLLLGGEGFRVQPERWAGRLALRWPRGFPPEGAGAFQVRLVFFALALGKKMSGHAMMRGTVERFHEKWMNLDKVGAPDKETAQRVRQMGATLTRKAVENKRGFLVGEPTARGRGW